MKCTLFFLGCEIHFQEKNMYTSFFFFLKISGQDVLLFHVDIMLVVKNILCSKRKAIKRRAFFFKYFLSLQHGIRAGITPRY